MIQSTEQRIASETKDNRSIGEMFGQIGQSPGTPKAHIYIGDEKRVNAARIRAKEIMETAIKRLDHFIKVVKFVVSTRGNKSRLGKYSVACSLLSNFNLDIYITDLVIF